MDCSEYALGLLPASLRQAAATLDMKKLEEIRLRAGRRPTALFPEGERAFTEEPVSEETLLRVLEKATGASIHTAAHALSEGYLSYRGVRIGVCGTGVIKEGVFSGYRRYSSLSIRVPRECRGIVESQAEALLHDGFQNTLIIGRPGDGKTTVLRELIRTISERGIRVGVSDERNELAAVDRDSAFFDLGRWSDVMTGIPKADGAMMLLRGMNPQILAMDEITKKEDLEAIRQIFGCGVGVLATMHGTTLQDLRSRPDVRELLDQGLFSWLITVQRHGGKRSCTLERIRV